MRPCPNPKNFVLCTHFAPSRLKTPRYELSSTLYKTTIWHTATSLKGPVALAKKMAAIALAQSFFCTEKTKDACGQCKACLRAIEGNHPDLRIVEPRAEGSGNVKVELIREEILPFTRFAPFEGRAAFVIFTEVEKAFPSHQAEAANALLKTLEEPKNNLHFILLSERPAALLSTIRSRCQRLRFRPLPHEVIESILEEHNTPQPRRQLAIALCNGQADRALSLAAEPALEHLIEDTLAIDRALEKKDPAELFDLAESLAADEKKLIKLQTLAWLYRDQAVQGLNVPARLAAQLPSVAEPPSSLPVERALAQREPYSDKALIRLSIIRKTHRALEKLATPQLTLEAMLFELAQTC
ncbi:MAG: hypothetical protein IPJ88_09795 [Myxococcales bacterium]|nr:MAG: hypothetical protein IPJ88_09795 [Myxococcales bacterium]